MSQIWMLNGANSASRGVQSLSGKRKWFTFSKISSQAIRQIRKAGPKYDSRFPIRGVAGSQFVRRANRSMLLKYQLPT
jgi:hypothetical protein